MPFPSADAVAALLNTFGPLGAALIVLIYVLRKPTDAPPQTGGFDAEQKLWLKEHVVDPIIKALKE